MADFSGRKILVGIGKEATRGTSVAPTYGLPHLDVDFNDKQEKAFNESSVGVLNKNNDADPVKDWGEGKISGKVTDKSFGLILLAAFGVVNTAANADGSGTVKDHTFTQDQTTTANIPQSLTLVRKDANGNQRFALAMLKSLEIEVAVGEYVKYTADFMTKKGVTGADTITYTVENEFRAKHATAKLATNKAGLSGATAIKLASMKLTIERKLNPYFVFGTNDPDEIYVEEIEVKGDAKLRYTDGTYKTLWQAATMQALGLYLSNTDVTIGTSARPALQFELDKVTVSEWDVDQSKDSMVEQTLGFEGLYDLAAASAITAKMTNLVTSY